MLSERYGLSPGETAEVLATACAPPEVVVQVVLRRCDGDQHATVEACRPVLDPHLIARALRDDPVLSEPTPLHPIDPNADEFDRLRDALGEPADPPAGAAISTDEGLIAALDAAAAGRAEIGLERAGHE